MAMYLGSNQVSKAYIGSTALAGVILKGGQLLGIPRNATFKSKALQILGSQEGFAIDFVDKRMIVNDSTTPANAYDGDPEALLTKRGADAYQYNGLKGWCCLMFETSASAWTLQRSHMTRRQSMSMHGTNSML